MGMLEVAIPKKYRSKFTAAVAAQRSLAELYRREKPPTDREVTAKTNAVYVKMNALPLTLQVLAKRKAKQ